MQNFVLHFNEINKNSLPMVGGKGANLGEMTKAGFTVPEGFCITTDAYKIVTTQDNTLDSLITELDSIDPDNLEKINEVADSIRNHIKSLPILPDIRDSIINIWKEIGQEKSYAIRSSATAEDLPGASFAGQQDTYLNIKGETEILQCVRNCWASLFTDRAISYRTKNNFPHKSVFLSVVVQEMIFSEVSGIMFTANPVSGKRNNISINASFGLGEALVGGLVLSDLYQVSDSKIVKKEIGEKKIQIISLENGGTIKTEIDPKNQSIQALSDSQILELSKIGKNIDIHYNYPQDIEWCLKDNKFYIVQSRPITSLYPLPSDISEGLHFYFSVGHLQMMTEAMKPMGFSIFLTFAQFVERYFKMQNHVIVESGSRIYFDLMQIIKFKIFQKNLPELLVNIDETASKILIDFMNQDEFKNIKTERISFKRAWILIKFVLFEIKLFFFGNHDDIFDQLNKAISKEIIGFRNDIEQTTSIEKIKKIKAFLTSLPVKITNTKILNYMPLAIGSYKLLGIFSKKRLGDMNEVDAIGKAPKGNVTTEMGLFIGDLAFIAQKNPLIKSYLENAKNIDFWENLEKIEGSKDFTNSLHLFFEKYGMRCTGEIDITRPRWKEDPTQIASIIIKSIDSSIEGQHRKDFLVSREKGIEAGEKIIERIKKTRFGYFKALFMKRLIYVHRSTIGVREHPKYFIINIFDIIKDTILEEADKLVTENKLESAGDIYYFTIDEIDNILHTKTIDTKLLQQRKAKYTQNKELKPPRVFTGDGEILKAKPNINLPKGALSGTAASAGIVEGRARVIKRLEEANLEKGDILVTAYTDPAWTTLFGIASGVVTEVGGLLTHGAVVAREYGIPAVVGVDDATKKIVDGDMIRVNGSEGYVEIEAHNLSLKK